MTLRGVSSGFCMSIPSSGWVTSSLVYSNLTLRSGWAPAWLVDGVTTNEPGTTPKPSAARARAAAVSAAATATAVASATASSAANRREVTVAGSSGAPDDEGDASRGGDEAVGHVDSHAQRAAAGQLGPGRSGESQRHPNGAALAQRAGGTIGALPASARVPARRRRDAAGAVDLRDDGDRAAAGERAAGGGRRGARDAASASPGTASPRRRCRLGPRTARSPAPGQGRAGQAAADRRRRCRSGADRMAPAGRRRRARRRPSGGRRRSTAAASRSS